MPKDTRKQKPSIDEFAEATKKAALNETQQLARTLRAQRAIITEQQETIEVIREKLGLYETITTNPPKPPTWLAPKKISKDHEAIPCMMLTDIHWDEYVKPEQVDFVNKYDRAIAEMRLRRAFKRAIHVCRDYMAGVRYTGFQLFLGGDLLSGIIHEELRESNRGTIIEGILSISPFLVAGIKLLADEFGLVNVDAVVGNHGRRTLKPVAKNRAQDNFDWLVYKWVAEALAGDKRITMRVADAPDAHVQVHNTKYLLTHGDQFKGGTGISSALSPLLLGVHRKTKRQNALSRPFRVMVMGHFHKSIWMPEDGLIVGGSVIGYNEYAYQQNMTPEPPQCALWLNTPERGITVSAPVFVSDRQDEGW